MARGEAGFLAPERDWRKLAEYIIRLFRDDALWRRFAKAGRRRVEELFDLQKQTAALENIYDGALLRHRRFASGNCACAADWVGYQFTKCAASPGPPPVGLDRCVGAGDKSGANGLLVVARKV